MADEALWNELEEKCNNCKNCPLYKTKTNTVFGVGNKNAKLMFVGEAPGESEDLSGVPFVGAAGKLFDKYLSAIGLSRDEVYIANILKCRPPKNRDPEPSEEEACIGFLREQTKLISQANCLSRQSFGKKAYKRRFQDNKRAWSLVQKRPV